MSPKLSRRHIWGSSLPKIGVWASDVTWEPEQQLPTCIEGGRGSGGGRLKGLRVRLAARSTTNHPGFSLGWPKLWLHFYFQLLSMPPGSPAPCGLLSFLTRDRNCRHPLQKLHVQSKPLTLGQPFPSDPHLL